MSSILDQYSITTTLIKSAFIDHGIFGCQLWSKCKFTSKIESILTDTQELIRIDVVDSPFPECSGFKVIYTEKI